jgi:tetratricopeptide (TPR) repeat protein
MHLRVIFFTLLSSVIVFSFLSCNSNTSLKVEKNTIDDFPVDSFAFYENALVSDSLNVDLRFALANNYYVKEQFEKAISHLLIICQIDNRNEAALITLGNIYYDTEQFEKAIEYYEKALVLDDKNVNVRCDMATCYLNIKKPEKALVLLKKNIEMDHNHAQSHFNLSVVYKALGKTKEAEEELAISNKFSK